MKLLWLSSMQNLRQNCVFHKPKATSSRIDTHIVNMKSFSLIIQASTKRNRMLPSLTTNQNLRIVDLDIGFALCLT
jgi:hypothetical protein